VLATHFTPVTVPVDRAKLAALIVGDTNVAAAPVPGITPGTQGVDLYVVLVKMRGKSNDNTAGLTMWSRGGDGFGAVFSQYAVLLVEPKTGRTVVAVPGVASPKFPSPLPDRMIAKTNLPNPGAAGFEPDQQSAARILLTQMMDDSIEETALRLRLTGRKIEAGGADMAEATVGDNTTAAAVQAPN
jgi:hypothetical protein